jgi:hypothetical protein
LEWEVVWGALKTEPPAETLDHHSGARARRRGRVIQTNADVLATAFAGIRHGRHVALRMGVVPSMVRARGYNEVRVDAPVAPFRIRESGQRPVAEPGAPPEVEDVLAALHRGAARGATSRSRAARMPPLPVGR